MQSFFSISSVHYCFWENQYICHELSSHKDRNQMFQPSCTRGTWLKSFKASFSQTNQKTNKLSLSTSLDKRLHEISRTFSKKSTLQMFRIRDLDASLNTSRFPGGVVFAVGKIAQVYYTTSQVTNLVLKTIVNYFTYFAPFKLVP